MNPPFAERRCRPRHAVLRSLAALCLLSACGAPTSMSAPAEDVASPDAAPADAPPTDAAVMDAPTPPPDVAVAADAPAEAMSAPDVATPPPDVATPPPDVAAPPLDVTPPRDVATPPPDVTPPRDVAGPDVPAGPRWTLRSNPCPGINRTDALHVDDDGTVWIGCGSGAEGAGLFRGTSEGASWTQVRGTSDDVLGEFRVMSIERGADGALYLGGNHGATRTMGLRVDTRTSPPGVEDLLVGTTRLGTNFIVGTLRMRGDGTALAESLTGTDVLWRPTSAAGVSAWTDVRATWSTDGTPRQILDLVSLGDRFVGCGATIADRPYVYLPSTAAGAAPYRMTPLVLSTSWTGELWGVAASAARVVAVGEDQRNHRGKILVSGADPTVLSAWRETELGDAVGTTGWTWARGVCMRGDRVVVTGERQPLRGNSGIVVESLDAGRTWRDITPAGVSSTTSKCVIRPDGTLIVAGASGQVGFYR